jgi:2-oxoglutarate ferredoxin oxidoreductase subunit gamma
MLQTARMKLAKEVVANMVSLGVVARLSGLASEQALLRAVVARVPPGTEDLNRRALRVRFELGSAWLEREAASAEGSRSAVDRGW